MRFSRREGSINQGSVQSSAEGAQSPSTGRLIRFLHQQHTTTILHAIPLSSGLGRGCPGSGLEQLLPDFPPPNLYKEIAKTFLWYRGGRRGVDCGSSKWISPCPGCSQEVLGDRTVSTTRHAIVSGVSAAGIVVAGSYQTPVFISNSSVAPI